MSTPPAFPHLAATIAATGRTVDEVAIKIGVHPQTLSAVIRGRMRPSPAFRIRTAEVLKVDEVDWLFELAPEVERLIQMAVDQGLGRSITEAETLRKIAILVAPHPLY